VSRREAVHVLGGQFRPQVVLRRRATALLVAASLLGAFAVAAALSGGGSVAAATLWAAGAVGVSGAPLAAGAMAQVRRWRFVADAVAGATLLVGVAVAMTRAEPSGGAGPGLAGVALAVVVGVVTWWVVLRLVPARLDADGVAARGTRTARAGQGMVAGDTRAAARALPVRYRGPRRVLTTSTILRRRAPILARDLLGQRRRPVVTAGGAVAALAGVWLALTVDSRPARMAAGLLLYAAVGALGLGMAAFLAQPVPGGLLPGRGRTVLAWHAALPGLALACAIGLCGVVAGLLGRADGPGVLTAVVLAVMALGVRAWAAGGSAVPAALYTPVVTPLGDLSVMNVAAYFVRGWLVVAGVGWLTGAAHDGQGWVVPVLAAAFFASRAARAAER
jgi:hypothetical protein